MNSSVEMRHTNVDEDVNRVTGSVIDAAIRVHDALGPGLLERAYRICLAHELGERGHRVAQEVLAPVIYRGARVDVGFRIDLIVDDLVIVELKAVEEVHPVHEKQVFTYLKLTGCPVGLLINFNVPLLKEGLRRIAGP